MKDTTRQEEVNGGLYDYREDFTILVPPEKREVLKTAKGFLRLQRENALLAGPPIPPAEVN